MNSNRRDLWSGEDLEGQDQNKVLWNRYLLEEVIAVACVDLIDSVSQSGVDTEDYYTLWPDCDHLSDSWRLLGEFVYKLAAKKSLLYTEANDGDWVDAKQAVIVSNNSVVPEKVVSFLLKAGK